MKKNIQRALAAKRESKCVDFKSSLDFTEPHGWCEIIKDMIAMANSGGGFLVIGLDNKGSPTGFDPTPIFELDDADVTNQIEKYTGEHFDDFEISEEHKGGNRLAVIAVEAVSIPIVFTRPGTYAVSEKKQKTAFSPGTVYFRHGAKSEPGDTNDIRRVVERHLESIRQSWISGVRKVVKAPAGSQIYTFPSGVEVRESASPDARAIRIVDDPDAPAYRKLDYDDTHPFRQKEAVAEINRGLPGRKKINAFDIQCVNRVYGVFDKENFRHCPRYSSPQYSREFVAWVISQYQQDNEFFQKARDADHKQRH